MCVFNKMYIKNNLISTSKWIFRYVKKLACFLALFNNSSTFLILSKTPTDFYIRLIPKDELQLRDRSRQLLNIDKLVFNNQLTDTV